ncbi:class I SAM-dependent methyltransferase [Aspergillus neoniger CBS 115656]|uniref:Methyltransferase domain-containing protein n=1 Tax=Aspergillus neoniger (strain CBS 115656) TaxID=1448310 RepID=A0A318YLB0_ASPNB|nr:hypothetical protein BO87DRAFT_405897 [Aspergillus neoniger CBS 115656]PYH35355.1 hypothetical protein BO87DRAFT_405897 [Aspergillus neoniger CBS 115656]
MPPPEYVLPRDYLDNNRIKLQHHLTTELFGYLLHLDIPLQNANLKIADIAAGTGIVLTDLSRRLPSSVYLDAELLPRNVGLYRWDIKVDVPTELEGAYDVVHVRNIVFVLSDEEIEDVLSKLLKHLNKINGECSTAAIEEIVRITRSADPRLVPHWVPELPRLFESVGLVDLRKDTREGPGHIDYTFHECVLMVHDMIARKTSNEGETFNGAFHVWTRQTVIGRKRE